jgi:hypothetical protein
MNPKHKELWPCGTRHICPGIIFLTLPRYTNLFSFFFGSFSVPLREVGFFWGRGGGGGAVEKKF